MCIYCTFYSGEFECSGVECLHSLSLHCNVGFLQAVFLQQVVHLQKMLPKVLRQQLDLRESRRRGEGKTREVEG